MRRGMAEYGRTPSEVKLPIGVNILSSTGQILVSGTFLNGNEAKPNVQKEKQHADVEKSSSSHS